MPTEKLGESNVELVQVTDMQCLLYENLALSTLDDPVFTYFQKRDFRSAFQNHRLTMLALIDKRIAGYYHIDIENHVNWFGLYISKPFRGQGLGQLLLQHAQAFAKKEQINLELMVYAYNTKAINLYKKIDFYITTSVGDKIFMRWKHSN
jgi:ribosomal protein S18 acetylase RimI-like enzyme